MSTITPLHIELCSRRYEGPELRNDLAYLLLQRRKATPLALMIEELEVSKATVKRDIEYMRDRMHALIVWDRELRGYRYELTGNGEPGFSMPGLWFNASEFLACRIK